MRMTSNYSITILQSHNIHVQQNSLTLYAKQTSNTLACFHLPRPGAHMTKKSNITHTHTNTKIITTFTAVIGFKCDFVGTESPTVMLFVRHGTSDEE